MSDFFVAGGTLSADARSYIPRRADAEIIAALRSGIYCYLLDSRQVGKSSLLIRTRDALRAEGIRVAVCDLQRVGGDLTADQFYGGLLAQIGRALGAERQMVRAYRADREEAPFARFRAALIDALRSSEQPLVILVGGCATASAAAPRSGCFRNAWGPASARA